MSPHAAPHAGCSRCIDSRGEPGRPGWEQGMVTRWCWIVGVVAALGSWGCEPACESTLYPLVCQCNDGRTPSDSCPPSGETCDTLCAPYGGGMVLTDGGPGPGGRELTQGFPSREGAPLGQAAFPSAKKAAAVLPTGAGNGSDEDPASRWRPSCSSWGSRGSCCAGTRSTRQRCRSNWQSQRPRQGTSTRTSRRRCSRCCKLLRLTSWRRSW